MLFHIILAVIFLFFTSIHGAVLGIDFGTEYTKSSLISPGRSFMIIEDTTSKRKTPSSLCFYENKRYYEYECATKRHRVPQSTFLSLRKYLSLSPKQINNFTKYTESNYEFLNGTYNTKNKRFDLWLSPPLKHALTFQQISSMVLKHIQQNVQRMADVTPKDVVLTIPYQKDPFMDIYLRQSLLETCKLADLNLLGFIHENVAANLYLALERLDATPVNIIIVNIGSGSMQVSVSQMLKVNSTEKKELQTLSVLSQVEEINVSGYVLDQIMAKILAKKFDENRKGKLSVLSSKSAMIKFHKESEKIKEVLSANKDINVYIENVFEGEDFHAVITRSEFEEEFSYFEQEIRNTLELAFTKANLTLKDINLVELVGGVTRVPKVLQILQEIFGSEIETGQHLNGDEVMAFGAAFYAANMSQSFRVRPIWLYDGFDFDIKLKISNLNNNETTFMKNIPLFSKMDKFGTIKAISFEYDENLKFEFALVDENGNEAIFKQIEFSNISDIKISEAQLDEELEITIQESPKNRQDRLKQIRDDQKNQTNLQKEEELVEKNQEKEQQNLKKEEQLDVKEQNNKKETVKNDKEEDKKVEENEQVSTEDKLKEDKEVINSTESNNETFDNSTENEAQNSNKTANQSYVAWADYYEEVEKLFINKSEFLFKTKTLNITHYIALSQNEEFTFYYNLNETEFEDAISVIKEFDQLEEIIKKNAEAKNILEALIYEIQPQKESKEFLKYSTEEEQQQIFTLLTENDDWLYSDEAMESNYTEFNKRHLEIYLPYQEIHNRINHAKQRPEVVKNNSEKLEEFLNISKSLNKTMPWVHKEEFQNLKWFQNITELQNKKALFENPVFTKDEVDSEMKIIENEISRIKRIRKPKNKTKKGKTLNLGDLEFNETLLNDNFTEFQSEINESIDSEKEQVNESSQDSDKNIQKETEKVFQNEDL